MHFCLYLIYGDMRNKTRNKQTRFLHRLNSYRGVLLSCLPTYRLTWVLRQTWLFIRTSPTLSRPAWDELFIANLYDVMGEG
jgi:hypothetical protein